MRASGSRQLSEARLHRAGIYGCGLGFAALARSHKLPFILRASIVWCLGLMVQSGAVVTKPCYLQPIHGRFRQYGNEPPPAVRIKIALPSTSVDRHGGCVVHRDLACLDSGLWVQGSSPDDCSES